MSYLSSFLITGIAILSVSFNAFAAERGSSTEIDADFEQSKSLSSCVNFTNLGTVNPKLLNSCNSQATVQVSNYAMNGKKVAERIFHLWRNEERPLAFPGYSMVIDWEKGWTNDGPDDGAGLVSLYSQTVDTTELWVAKNLSPDRFNAIQCIVYLDGIKQGISYKVIAPGQTERMYPFPSGANGVLILEWARLDPK